MRDIQILDVTLRDGGYCNDCHFGFENQKKIINGLNEAGINIIECGFYNETVEYDEDYTRFNDLSQVSKIIPAKRDGKTFVVLADHGKFDPDKLPEYDGTSADGFRVAFHKKDLLAGLEDCKKVKAKGYKVFVQPMVSVSYKDEEFLDLIHRVNELMPYAFYIVDSFGMMKEKDLTRLFYEVEHNLADGIKIGFHSHNNMQLAYSNAQSLVRIQSNRSLVLDSSIYGMGRGAGNLNTELFVEYLNDYADGHYELTPILTIIDDILSGFYQKKPWGYSLPNYLSASHNTHPNYAGYFDSKKTLTVWDINAIFDMMDEDKRVNFDKAYAEELYLTYLASGSVHEGRLSEFKDKLKGKRILLISPGKSSGEEGDKIRDFMAGEDVVSISVNFNYDAVDTDYIFISNLRRYRDLAPKYRYKCIVTTKIPSKDVYLQVDYKTLLNNVDYVNDNAGLMAMKLMMECDVEGIYLGGLDGYSYQMEDNYMKESMTVVHEKRIVDGLNFGMNAVMREYAKQTKISFITTPKYITLGE